MQLVFTVDEFRVLIDALLESEREELSSDHYVNSASPLLQKALAHDFGFGIDELEDLEEILKAYSARLAQQACRDNDEEAMRRRALLSRVQDRVTEACAMA
jgi:hypothetical protein